MLLLSLDEFDRVKRMNRVDSYTALEELTGITRKTWSETVRKRRASWDVLDALEALGARPHKLLISDSASETVSRKAVLSTVGAA